MLSAFKEYEKYLSVSLYDQMSSEPCNLLCLYLTKKIEWSRNVDNHIAAIFTEAVHALTLEVPLWVVGGEDFLAKHVSFSVSSILTGSVSFKLQRSHNRGNFGQ